MNEDFEAVVISVGGSIILGDKSFDAEYLTKLKNFAIDYIEEKNRLAIIIGGGKLARDSQEKAKKVNPDLTDDDKDWIGIYATRFNAQVVAQIFKGYTSPEIITNPTKEVSWEYPILFAAGWEPGCSTDYDAVLLAKNLGSRRLVNLTNVDHVYTADPKKDNSAKLIRQISWAEFRESCLCRGSKSALRR